MARSSTPVIDPRELLGVHARATPQEVRRAHARLTAHVVNGGAPDEIVLLLAEARDAALDGRSLTAPPARFVFGLPSVAPEDDVRRVWRAIAAVAHPDRGGTPGLFRVASDAHDELVGRVNRRSRWDGRRGPPAKPPPRGPFRAPKPEDRLSPRRRQAYLDLGFGLAVLVLIAFVAAMPLVWWRGRGAAVAFALTIGGLMFVRGVLHDSARALVRLWGNRRAIAENEAPDRFLAERALDAPVGRVEQSTLYDAYVAWCRARGGRGVSVWRFVEELRSYGLLYVHGTGGDSARWVGLRLREPTT